MKLEELVSGIRLAGLVPHEVVQVIFAQPHGPDAVEVTYKTSSGDLDQRVVLRRKETDLSVSNSGSRPFDASASEFKLAAEAQRIKLAGSYDPMLAVATSNVQPLPHQIRAVYGELLPRTPLRFLLADDPGAGKTIMAGLYIKELILREDVQRCLIVAPGGLVEQWQDELFFKFGLSFDILTTEMIEAGSNINVFQKNPLLIARMDQLARNDSIQRLLQESQWDLTIVDEAHRMGAHYFGNKLEKTKRFQLGELLGEISRHFLLMTATPHSGKEGDFQLFLSLLDKDRFTGRNEKSVDTSDVMRRMVKEDLLTFEGRRLFPERVAETIPYELIDLEIELYDQVTDYVRHGMNRAASLLDGKRRNTVGFALTVLQRRLASSPEAILRSLLRRADRLTKTKKSIADGTYRQASSSLDIKEIDSDSYLASEVEEFEESVLDAATAAESIAELDAEILELKSLAKVAQRLLESGLDRKWSELQQILEANVIPLDAFGNPRKLIIFTEHRDTLNYLSARIKKLIPGPEAVVAIHGGVRRTERRATTEEFTKNPACQIMLATDAAGEGINLQAAHLMVNYDLPWNPNRIEQRFGRIHRIGQTHVCRLWNLVASNTREGEVFNALLTKIDEQRRAYGGKVFDVLGAAFPDTTLRDLLVEAIRYGDSPQVKAKMQEVIDHGVAEGLRELIDESALASDALSENDLTDLQTAMDEARARRLQPYYIELAFKVALGRYGGRLTRREKGRYELANVPAVFRNTTVGPVASRYERLTFDLDAVQPEGQMRADLLAPGHPLHDSVMEHTVTALAGILNRGTVLVSTEINEPRFLVGVVEEVVDGTGQSISRRFSYAYACEDGSVIDAGPAPYLDCVAAPDHSTIHEAKRLPWLDDAESRAVSWIITHRLPEYLSEVQPKRTADLEKQRGLVTSRLKFERERLLKEVRIAEQKERAGEKPQESAASLTNKAAALQTRLDKRLELIDRQSRMDTKPPLVVSAALVLPSTLVAGALPTNKLLPCAPRASDSSKQRAIDRVMAAELAIGRQPLHRALRNPAYDILSTNPSTGETFRLLVEPLAAGTTDLSATHNQVLSGKNAQPRYRLALVAESTGRNGTHEVRYIDNPFTNVEMPDFDTVFHQFDAASMWDRGRTPF
ncbi:helicase-related protein [Rhodococcus sp. IEGM 1408]|uniref:helicase-related protein n=1 Tax=Rhodococcus sp. IEGM 1408 TaxID=3082220 RepID=UPI002952D341|nr:helicase-related protein [Rhodococcus sp. IEGM 1408]MDV8002803.1 helicase-related protein [Rhodococcus sp. IEGM 1408]